MLNSKTIRAMVVSEMHARLGSKWLELGSAKCIVSSEENTTDLNIEINISVEKRYNVYECSALAVLKWKLFSTTFKRFIDFYNSKFERSAKAHSEMVIASFNNIEGNFGKGRGPFWVANQQDLDAFIAQCVDDLDGKVGDWIVRWFTWPSALAVMDGNKNLSGSWRNTAYFCLLEHVNGREAACSWLHGLASTNWPEFQGAQVEYLRSQVCSADPAPPVSTTSAR